MTDEPRALELFVIYERPTDYPKDFVVRAHHVNMDGGVQVDREPVAVVPTLSEARAALPPGLVRFMREQEDPLAIVEIWL